MGVSKKKIVVKSEEDSDGEEKGRLCFVIRPTEGLGLLLLEFPHQVLIMYIYMCFANLRGAVYVDFSWYTLFHAVFCFI